MNRSIYLHSEEVSELRVNKELAKIVLPGSGYDRLDILSVYCFQGIDKKALVTELEVIVTEKTRLGKFLLTSLEVLILRVL